MFRLNALQMNISKLLWRKRLFEKRRDANEIYVVYSKLDDASKKIDKTDLTKTDTLVQKLSTFE